MDFQIKSPYYYHVSDGENKITSNTCATSVAYIQSWWIFEVSAFDAKEHKSFR